MSLTPSQMIALGTKAPDFSLRDVVSGKFVSLSDYEGKNGLLVMFICNHCPYVKHVAPELAKLGRYYGDKGIGNADTAAVVQSTYQMKTGVKDLGGL